MYAIIRTGGKQYKVRAGDLVRVEKLNAEPGAELELTDVLMVGGDKTFIGEPTVRDAKVLVVVTKQDRAAKLIVFKKKRRQGYRKMQGHRQLFTELFVKAITSPEGQTSNAESAAKVYSPDKKREREDRIRAWKATSEGASASGDTPMASEPVKKAAKKAAPKKSGKVAKAKGAKKPAAKKGAAKAKATKKVATTKKKAKAD